MRSRVSQGPRFPRQCIAEKRFPLAPAEVLYDLSRGWTAKAVWNCHGYGEKDGPGPTLPRNFHANSVTLSTIYAF